MKELDINTIDYAFSPIRIDETVRQRIVNPKLDKKIRIIGHRTIKLENHQNKITRVKNSSIL